MDSQVLKNKAGSDLKELHLGELAALNIYTQGYYKNINGLLRGMKPFQHGSPTYQRDMRELILHIGVALSGVNKGKSSKLPMTYRYDKNLPEEILKQRIKCAQSKGANIITFEDAAFVSSALVAPLRDFKGRYRTVFHGLHGLNVSSISYYPKEREFLIPPSKMKYLTHQIDRKGQHYFLACPVIAPTSTQGILNLKGGGSYETINQIIETAESEMVIKFAQFTIAATKVYLQNKEQRDLNRWTLFAAVDNAYGKGAYKIQYAQTIKSEAEALIKKITTGLESPKFFVK